MCMLQSHSHDLRHKLQESSVKGIFVGYGKVRKGYRIYNLETKKIIMSMSVIFDENAKWDANSQ